MSGGAARFIEPQKLLHLRQLFSLTDFGAFRLKESTSEARAENAVWNQRGRFFGELAWSEARLTRLRHPDIYLGIAGSGGTKMRPNGEIFDW